MGRKLVNLEDYRQKARGYLPAPLFHYIEGGADDEYTLGRNTDAYRRYDFSPNYLRDMRAIDTGTTLFGRKLSFPLLLAPTGMTRLFHPGGELAVARAADAAGVGYSLSTMATTSLEDVATTVTGLKVFQLYLLTDDGLNLETIDRCKAAGYDALCLTVDTVVPGSRERDARTGMTVPPKLSLRSLVDFSLRPRWCLDYLLGEKFDLPNCRGRDSGGGDLSSLAVLFASIMDRNITWERAEKLIRYWGKPFAIKGILSVEDAVRAADIGASAIVISNHGGRQLDGAPATIDVVAEIADAVGDRVEIIVDGGIRRGSQIVKALAMGARACMVGRPYLYGLASGGEQGVAGVLETLRRETERTMGLIGCTAVTEIGRKHLRAAAALPAFLSQ
ncbi:MAG: alpha-hydroxy acid oxidase [Pseudomonadota bacterium]|jgi:L-lactate dehydrogenase (cytochrome)|nr:alpha-hydroxy acid oxidase [Pseudomonadota bacterium]